MMRWRFISVRLHKNIADCYRYLIQNYTLGDEIFLFVCRGAYTIRALCGLLITAVFAAILCEPNESIFALSENR